MTWKEFKTKVDSELVNLNQDENTEMEYIDVSILSFHRGDITISVYHNEICIF